MLGALLPLLPTAPFVLVAGACFARAWPAADRWLARHRIFGPLRGLGTGKPVMTRAAKRGTIVVVALSFAATIVLAPMHWAVRTGVAVLGLLVLTVVAKQPTLDSPTLDGEGAQSS